MKKKNPRLFPSWTHSRYYGLTKLRKANQLVIDKFIKRSLNEKVMLDYGCGSMPYRVMYEPYLRRYIGADISINKLAEVQIENNSGKIDIEDKFVDYILSTQVLEHVESPENYLKEAYRIAKDDSLLIISTHGFWMYHPDPTDYWRWTYAGLEKTLIINGWKPIFHIGIIGFAGAGLSLFQDGISQKLPSFLRKGFCICMQRLIAFVDYFYTDEERKEDCTLYLIVAKKC